MALKKTAIIELILRERGSIATTKDLKQEFQQLNRTVDFFEGNANNAFKIVDKGGNKAKRSLKDVGSSTKNLGSSMLSTGNIARWLGGAAIGATLYRGMQRGIEKGREFEQQLASLEAITGITGNSLQSIADRSLELSAQYGESASNIIEANKLVASQLAQKIDFGTDEGVDQLQSVAQQAVVLQKAAGTDLKTAVETVTSVINQFNLEASESERVINTLAAGAKFGAAEVPAISRALVNAGAAADGANLSIEETNAAIQVLAANGQVGERAGTALRAIFTRLQTKSKELAEQGIQNVDIRANGLVETLRQLNPIMNDTVAINEIFGEEAQNQLSILLKNVDGLEELQNKVTGTNIAYEQAEVQMNTFDGAADRLASTFDSKLIVAFQETNGAMVQLMNATASLIDQFAGGIHQINVWLDAQSEVRREIANSESATNAQISSMSKLRQELAAAAAEGNLTAEQEQILKESFDATTEALRSRASGLFDETHAMKLSREEIEGKIAALEEQEDTWQGLTGAQAQQLDTLRDELRGLDMQIASNESQLKQLTTALQEGTLGIDAYIQKIKEMNEGNKDQEDEQKTLTEQIDAHEGKITELITKSGELTEAEKQQIITLKNQVAELEKILRLRSQIGEEAPEVPRPEVEAPEDEIIEDPLTEEQTEIDLGLGAPLGSIQRMQDKLAELRQSFANAADDDSRRKIASEIETVEANLESMTSKGNKGLAENAQMLGQAGAQAILYADSVQEAGAAIIKTLINEIITRAILAAFNPPTPASLALAPIFAAAAQKLIGSLVGFRSGVDEFEGGMARVHKGEIVTNLPQGSNVITNANVERMERVQRQASQGADNLAAGSASVIANAVRQAVIEGMQQVELRPQVNLSKLDKELERLRNFKSRIGN